MNTSWIANLRKGNHKSAEPFVLIYTTAAPSKPSYRRGILDALCYPNGHILPYSYRRHHIRPELLENTKRLAGKNAVIIFVDLDPEHHVTYFPLRRVKIRDVIFETGTANQPAERERVNLSLELYDFVEYQGPDKAQWQERVERFDSSRQIQNERPSYFVIEGSDTFPRSCHSVATAWEDLVTAVSKSAGFAKAVFLRLDHIRPYDSNRESKSRYSHEHGRLVYNLRPGSIYRMNFSVFEILNSNSGNGTELEILTSAKDVVEAVQPFQSVVSGVAEKSTLIVCKRTIEKVITTLTVCLKGPAANEVNTPNPTIFARVSVSLVTLAGFLALIFFGSLFVSIDKAVVSEAFATWHPAILAHFAGGYPASMALVLKIVGASLLAWAAFLAFRKLPSGER